MRRLLKPLFWLPVALSLSWAAPPARVEFARDIRPLLSDHCFACHGPDDKARKGRLRLDLRADALKGGKSGSPALVPGKPGESYCGASTPRIRRR